MNTSETIVIGGGMVGAAIAWGLARKGMSVTVLDGSDSAARASRANFGLVWGQSKGDTLPEYARWTQESIALWQEFENELLDETGVSCGYSGKGGLHICMSEEELDDRRALFERMRRIEGGNSLDLRMLDRQEVDDLMPGIGPKVVGAGFCAQDGHVSPHGALMSVHRAVLSRGGRILSNRNVTGLRFNKTSWRVTCGDEHFDCAKLVLAAGTGNKALGELLGLEIPVFGLKGQILVTERVQPWFQIPSHKVRQTEAGTLLLGDSKEPEAGFDDRSSASVLREIAGRAVSMFPKIAEVNLVRAWAGIRSMTADGYPIYDRFEEYPGLFAANCHSGVTLAPVHAMHLAPLIAEEAMTAQVEAMSSRRFDVQA
ncbi:MAG: FAD-dependent oxidoreductase [Pseudomonadota bacterium]